MNKRNIQNSRDLQMAIEDAERLVQSRESGIKEKFAELKVGLQPQNFIKNLVRSICKTPDLKTLLLKSAIGVAVGYFAKMSMEFSTNSIIRFLENAINFQVKSFEEKHPQNILTKALVFLRKFLPHNSGLHAFIKTK